MRINVFKTGGNSAQGGFVSNGLTLQGPLILSGPHTDPLHAVPKQYVDNVAYHLHADNITSGVLAAARMPAFSGDASTILGSGNIILSNTGVTPGSLVKPTVDAKGRVTGSGVLEEADISSIGLNKITINKPTTLDGYGITDGVKKSVDSTITGNLILHANPVDDNHAVTKQYVDTAAGVGGGISVGDIIRKPYTSTPTGFLKCNGGEVEKASYPGLYSVIGDRFAEPNIAGHGRPWSLQSQFNENDRSALGQWVNGTTLPGVMGYLGYIVTKNRIYTIGGASGGSSDASVYTAPIATDGTIGSWLQSGNNLPITLGGGPVVVTKNRVFVFGGASGTSSYVSNVYSAAINSDGTLGSWVGGPNLPAALGLSSAVVIKNRVYLIGGYNGSSPVSVIYMSTINSDGTLNSWSVYGSIPYAAYGISVAAIKDKLYIFGGHGSTGLSNVYYAPINQDGTLGTWESSIFLPEKINLSVVACTKSRVYIVGGYNGSASINSVYHSDINSDGTIGPWVKGENLPGNRYGHGVVFTSSKLYLVGGHNGSGYLNSTIYCNISGGKNDYSSYYGRDDGTSNFSIAGSGRPWEQQYQLNTSQTGDITGWTAGSPLVAGAGQTVCFVTKNRVYICGVCSATNTYNSNIYTAPINTDGTLGTWVQAGTGPSAFSGAAYFFTKNRIYIAGGFTGSAYSSAIYYAPINADGTIGAFVNSNIVLPQGNTKGVCFVTKNKVYHIGGYSGSAHTSSIYVANIYADGSISSFTQEGNIPANTYAAVGAVTKNYVYIIAGTNGPSNVQTVYFAAINANGSLGQWLTGPQLPGSLSWANVYVSANNIYVLGGWSGSVITSTVYRAPIDSSGMIGAWVAGTTLPTTVNGGYTFAVKNRLYYAGGVTVNGGNAVTTVNSAVIGTSSASDTADYSPYYDGTVVMSDTTVNYLMPGSGKPWQQQYQINTTQITNIASWVAGTSLPGGLCLSQAIVTKNRVYLLGGYNGASNVSTVYTAPINADGTLDTWTTGTSLPGVLSNSCVVVTNNRVYLLGGMNTPTTYVATVYTAPINADGTLGTWTTGTSLPSNFAYSSVVITNNRIYLCGGHNGSSHTSTVYTATINSDGTLGTWTTGTSLPGVLTFSSIIVTNNRIYLTGGFNGSSHVSTVYTAPINADGTIGTWTTGTSLPGILSRSQAIVTKNRAYLFGGDGNQPTFVPTVYTAPINDDGTLGTWAAGTSLPGGLCLSQAIVTKNKVHLLGGYTGVSTVVSTVYTADISSDIQDYSSYYDGTIQPVSTISTKFKLPDYTQLDREFGEYVTSYIKY